ncbi:hypothetical protein VMT65_22230 [Nocardia sp. CDC153]|uniref:hypothetical protein n=1 Tax=Nocardia sp. CDC153 TaxID=3112167 RepID=UPI002DBC1100|nr:hypothetical protein [Nocardia sp. CDC153]MEC3955768.1 hypothetical protein [Nocardia sp. CDC153]
MATRRIRNSILGGAVTAATALAVLSTAPAASAQVTSVSAGTALAHVNSTYTLTAYVGGSNVGTQVSFWIADTSGNATYLGASPVASGTATLAWTPTAAGSYNIIASDDGNRTSNNAGSIGVSVTSVPAGQMGSGSASKIPIIGGVLSALLNQFGLA